MSIHEHEVRTKTDRLIAAVEALTAELRLARQSRVSTHEIPLVLSSKIKEVMVDDARRHGPISAAMKS